MFHSVIKHGNDSAFGGETAISFATEEGGVSVLFPTHRIKSLLSREQTGQINAHK
jgi:hypothetical protein